MSARKSSRPRMLLTLVGALAMLGTGTSSVYATPTLRVAIGSLSTTAAGAPEHEANLRQALEQAIDALPAVHRTGTERAQLVVQGSLVRLERTELGMRAEVSLMISERRGGAVRMLLRGRAEARGASDPVPTSISAAVRSAMRPLGDPQQRRLAVR